MLHPVKLSRFRDQPQFLFARFRQEFAFVAPDPHILPIRTALIPRSLADRVGFRIQERIQRILDGLSNQSVKMRPNLFFSSILIINQKTGPFSSALSQNVRNFPDVIRRQEQELEKLW